MKDPQKATGKDYGKGVATVATLPQLDTGKSRDKAAAKNTGATIGTSDDSGDSDGDAKPAPRSSAVTGRAGLALGLGGR